MATISLLSSSPTNSEASQIIGTINGVINQINSSALIGSQAPTSARNTVIGGDFTTNPWQRGTSPSAITNTLTYTADRFWAIGGASSSITITRQTSSPPPGFGAYLRFLRTAANADTTILNLGQVFTSNESYQYQGVPFVLSFYAKAGADFSSASSVLGISVAYGTGSDESASSFQTTGWTGYTSVQLTGSAGTQITGVTLTTSWARYVAAGFIPTTATQVGFKLFYTPVGTAGSADNFDITGIQFEKMPQGGVVPTPFENTNAAEVRLACMRYYQQINEPASTSAIAMGWATTTTTGTIPLPLPVPMRTTGTTTVLGAAGTSTWAIRAANGTLSGTITGSVQVGGVSNAQINIVGIAGAAATAGQPISLTGAGGTTAPIQISAEL